MSANWAFTFNAHEVAPATGIVVLPKGDYDVIFDSAEMKPTKSGKGGFIEARFKVMGGEHNGNLVIDRYNLWNENTTAVEIARAQLSALCHVTGVFVLSDGINTMNQQMKNKPFKVHLDVSLNEKKEPIGNEVKRIMNSDGSLAGRSSAPAQQASAPASFAPQAAPAPQQAPMQAAPSQPWGAQPAQQMPPQQAPMQSAPPAGQPWAPNGGTAPAFGQPMAAPASAPWMTGGK